MASRKRFQRPRPAGVLTLIALVLSSFLVPQLLGDDRELLRQNTGDAYLFVLLDTSMSMSLTIDDKWVQANGSDPRSRIYQAKEVLYEELKDLDGVRYGFATFNQDQLRVRSKHFLYYAKTDQKAKVDALGIGYPTVEKDVGPLFGGDDVVEYKVEVEPNVFDTIVDIDGDMMTFGQTFGGEGGSCDTSSGGPGPLRLNNDREVINRFSKLGADSKALTVIWVKDASNTYKVTFDGNPGLVKLGAPTINVKVTVEKVKSTGCPNVEPFATETLTLTLWRDFLMTDDGTGQVVFTQSGVNAGKEEAEKTGGFARWRDAVGRFECGDSKPFSGGGWEGNYDTGELSSNPTFEQSLGGYNANLTDTHCDVPGSLASCELLRFKTAYETNPDRRELDRGDVLPFHWNFDNKDDFLKRLNPNHGSGAPASLYDSRFSDASYFVDEPDATGRLQLKDPKKLPIVPMGISPVTDAIHDFRCWYVGPGNKCSGGNLKDNKGNVDDIYTKGFEKLLEEEDANLANCRRPFLIIISDMATNCPGNSPVANVAGMHSATGGGNVGVSTWVFNVGTGNVTGLVNAGKGEEIKVDSKAKLRSALREVIGLFEETSRSFASAAVPSVQADVEDKIYLTQFTPRQESSVWEGHVHAFVKPLPLKLDKTPDFSLTCKPTEVPPVDEGCHLWDAAEELKGQAPDPDTDDLSLPLNRSKLKIGLTKGERRLIYAIADSDPSTDADGDTVPDNDTDVKVPRTRSLFGPYTSPSENPATGKMDLNDLRKDLWRGMGIIGDGFEFENDPDDVADLFSEHTAVATEAHNVFRYTYAWKKVQPKDENGNNDGPEVKYVLGDIFHATPQLVGNPANGRYLARPDRFPGYEQFFQVQSRRRKVLFIASDDGQLHAFDAGRFARTDNSDNDPNVSVKDGRFNNGTGIEIFAYTPRLLLERLKTLADSSIGHEWGLDGTPAAGDVRIDPVHLGVGSSDPPKADDRQWRTVLVGGMRRGGQGYYALDITRPDKMIEEKEGGTLTIGWKPEDPTQEVPTCFRANGNPTANPGDCDPAGFNYPEVLWEFTDPDLGDTWSSPDVGAIEVIENGNRVLKYVAVFGGGMDPGGFLREADVTAGRMLYIVDVETGKMLYKRQLEGAAPSAPAAVDTDQDGLLDRIYIGTTEGLMYRVNINTPQELKFGNACPAPPSTPPAGSSDLCCASASGPVNGCVIDPAWEPFVIFDTATAGDPATRKPIFFAPAVIFSSQLGRFALAFGTGNRENLWAREQVTGNRFYLFVDDSDVIDPALLPRNESHYEEVTSQEGVGQDLLQDPDDGFRGWFIRLGTVPASNNIDVTHEKVLTQATAISGLNVFSTFVPETTTTSGTGSNKCARRGISRVFSQFTTNGDEVPVADENGNLPPPCASPPCERKPDEIKTLVSEPFIEQADQPCAGTEAMAEVLKERIFPPQCKFASYRWNLSAMRADTGVECLAQIPVCIIEKNWKDF